MRILLIDAFDTDDPDRRLVDTAISTLTGQGHQVESHHLHAEGFDLAMTTAERIAYEGDDPLQSGQTQRAAAAIKESDALVFCHPTSLYGVPPILKGWLDRVLVPGVAFVFDDKGKVAPGMHNIRRIGVVTTTRHSRAASARHRDLTFRTLGRTLWLTCNRRCRRTFVRIPAGRAGTDADIELRKGFRRWAS